MEREFDVVIIGAGPAGLQAAVHAVRKKASVLLLGRIEKSSLYRAHVENYLCVDGVKDGIELLNTGLDQVTRFGTQVLHEDVLQIDLQEQAFLVTVESGKQIKTLSIIFATGTSRMKLKVPGEKELSGKGVSYCVDCDANFYRNVPVAIVGNESAAVDGALTMLHYASEVFLISKESIVGERENLRAIEAKLKLSLSRNLSIKIVNFLSYIKTFIDRTFKKPS